MRQLTDFSDDRNRGICVHCGEGLVSEKQTRDHVPSKVLLTSPYPENLPVVHACRRCNSGFGKDEEYLAALLASVICGSTNPQPDRFPDAVRVLQHSTQLRGRIDRARQVQGTLWGDPEITWYPELERVGRIIVKNARGHVFFELGQPIIDPPSYVNILPFQLMSCEQRNQFEIPSDISGWDISGWPEVGSRLMQRVVAGECGPGGWIEVQDGVYRYAVSESLSVRMVLFEYLAAEVVWDESDIA